MTKHLSLLFFLFFTATTWAPNHNLSKQVVAGFPLTYQQLIDYVNATEFLPNNQINPSFLPRELREMRRALHSLLASRKTPGQECFVVILAKKLSAKAEEFTHSVLRPSLEGILDELLIFEELGTITPQPSYRAPRTVMHNPEDFIEAAFSTPSIRASSRSSSGSEESDSDYDEEDEGDSASGLDEDEFIIDTDSLSTLSSLSSRSTSPRVKGFVVVPTPESPGSSQSWPDFF